MKTTEIVLDDFEIGKSLTALTRLVPKEEYVPIIVEMTIDEAIDYITKILEDGVDENGKIKLSLIKGMKTNGVYAIIPPGYFQGHIANIFGNTTPKIMKLIFKYFRVGINAVLAEGFSEEICKQQKISKEELNEVKKTVTHNNIAKILTLDTLCQSDKEALGEYIKTILGPEAEPEIDPIYEIPETNKGDENGDAH